VNRWFTFGLATLGGGLAALGAVNTWLSWGAGSLQSALPGPTRFYHWVRRGQLVNVFYKVSEGEGAPVVLIHGIDAAASSYEMRHVFAGLSASHRVYALDLVGFGLSDRPGWAYAPDDYLDLIDGFLRDVVGEPAAVVASSLAAAYVVTVAARAPERIAKLLLICPTGLQHLADPPGGWQRALGRAIRLPIVGSALFNVLVSRWSLRYFLGERTYADPELVTTAMIDAYYCTSHQADARYAPAAFVAGDLNLSIRETYPSLSQPVFIVWGREAAITPVSDANKFIQTRRQSRLKVLDRAGLLPHDERPEEFLEIARGFLA
jgi:pimeloyl-ACP methyl ester carboxylesterase